MTADLYQNPDELAVWRGIRKASRAWRQRDRKILELVWAKYENEVPEIKCDLDPNAMIYLLVDTIHPKREHLDHRGPFNKLMNELVRHLATTLPSLTIKTGNSDKPSLEKSGAFETSLAVAMESMLSGSPLLFLDVRERPIIQAADRETLINQAKAEYDKACNALLQVGLAESFDAMTISYFHDVLFGDGNPSSSEAYQEGRKRGTAHVPLYEAIERAEDGRGATFSGLLAPASVQQINDTATWIANKFFSDAWVLLPDVLKLQAASHGQHDYATYYRDNISALSVHVRTIISGRNFHHLNLHDTDGASKLVGELVKLDRLPNETSLQGLLLLRGAWCDYDVAMHLASKYKVRSKAIFLTQLLVAWAMVLIGVTRSCAEVSLQEETRSILGHVLFGLATVVVLVSALDSILNAKTRWRQLRSCSCSLEAIMWCYRARIGRFQQSITESSLPEIQLCDAINAWRVELMSAADLSTTGLEKMHSLKVYKHHQWMGREVKQLREELAATKAVLAKADEAALRAKTEGLAAKNDAEDMEKLRAKLKGTEEQISAVTEAMFSEPNDHHSPVKPNAYIESRISRMMRFYQERLPVYIRIRFVLRMAVMLCTATSTVLAYLALSNYVVGVTSLAGAIISWTEFSETANKIERYTRAVRSLKMLLSWWDVLTDVERAGIDNISKLIETSEDIIADERQAWQATANRLGSAGRGGDGDANQGAEKGKAKDKKPEDVLAGGYNKPIP
jgi:hypothetical protein